MENIFTKNEQKVLGIFSQYPLRVFSAREIARLIKKSHPTVSKALEKLNRLGLVSRQFQENLSGFGVNVLWKANRVGAKYRLFKKIANLQQLYACNLIEKIASETSPNAIVLFGSYSRGEDTEESDIDLFVVSKEKQLDLHKYERQLYRKINLTFESDPSRLKKEFANNLANGIVLYGFFEVIK